MSLPQDGGLSGDVEDEIERVEARIEYLSHDTRLSRHFLSPQGDLHTDHFEAYTVTIRNGRPLRDRFSLDEHGFMLVDYPTAIVDFGARERVDTVYPDEGMRLVTTLTGADFVLPLGWAQRTTACPTPEQMLSHANDVHVDYSTPCAEQLAEKLHREARPNGPRYSRFILTGMWRCITEPPQDWPFTVCDARTLGPDEGVSKSMIHVDTLPEGEAMYAPIANEERCMASWVTTYNPGHRWWYFPNMTRDEVILLKHYDSGPTKATRVPHTAFKDPTFPHAPPRRSIEFRTAAFFY
jgi:hypothetical protein